MWKRLSPRTRRTIARVIPFGVIWTVTGWVFLFVEQVAQGFKNLSPDSAVSLSLPVLVFASIATMIVGCIVGCIEFIFLEKKFKNYSLGAKVFYKLLLYILFVYVVMFLTYPLASGIDEGLSPFDPKVTDKMWRFFMSVTFVSTLVQIGFSIFLCLIYAAVSENLGHQVLLNFFSGKYHHPKQEHRVFMFLDMKSSTTIAERIGHVKWFELLDEYYDAMSNPIIDHLGEAYQYIGDEIVVTWKSQDGLLNENCIRCFKAIGESLASRADMFREKFGVTPGFRAGIHLGEVTTGEVGALKKEIIFTGDVLNTTARIQALCKEYGKDLMVSQDLVSALVPSGDFSYEQLGSVTLRGKNESKGVCGVGDLREELT